MNELFNLNEFLNSLPNLPGVYRMIDINGQVLYVGKAVNLKRRVSSYFQKTELSPRIQLMVKQIDHVDITVSRSEVEALILENNLIKALAPKYNILFRDDKSYPYLKFSAHTFAQMSYYRGNLDKTNTYFGPFPNSNAVRDSIHILQKIFLLRTCEDSVFQNRQRPCLLFQIKRCSAPCVSAISQEEYKQTVQQAADFLNGKKEQELIVAITQKMEAAAQELNFEDAAKYRDQIQALSRVQEKQYVESQEHYQNIDVLVVVQEQEIVCVHWVSIRGGRHVGDKSFFPKVLDQTDSLQNYIEAFIAQHYLGKSKPDLILTNLPVPEILITALNEEVPKKIAFIHRTLGEKKVWLKMAERNAHLAIVQKMAQKQTQTERLVALLDVLALEAEDDLNNFRIECFDISHTQGEATVASCVVYEKETMQPSQYRRFNIETAKASDDYGAMREVLTRRYTRMQNEQTKLPDLVLIDGGKGQISVALNVWQELGLDIPLLGIAKGPERKAGLEELILPRQNHTIQLPPNHPALHLLQTIRDEAHRFAITGHRARRAKARVSSSLEDIPGVGTKRRQALLTRFGGLRGVQAASVEDLSKVSGVSMELAQKIYDHLH
ncbi:excinuclease ABC subunit UvrC [Neisseria sp. Ec49-e6-T10]|uniref:excinuclease ABC subunit UvrC n=1 Tax=Neisseria sp. Ec49-e6-T10 TaxID=3140744 RepID=UPI003EB79557